QARGFSRTELAARTGVSKPTVWAWETGRTSPRRNNLRSLARALDLSEEVLLGLADAEVAPSPSTTDRTNNSITLAQAIAESKARIADLAGTEPERVRITVEI